MFTGNLIYRAPIPAQTGHRSHGVSDALLFLGISMTPAMHAVLIGLLC